MRYMIWPAIILPWAPGLLPGLSFARTVFCPNCLLPELSLPRIAVLIAIMADGAIAGYRLASIFSLMRVLTGCRGGWWCLCQLGDQLGHQ
jgi:hypothetical protein